MQLKILPGILYMHNMQLVFVIWFSTYYMYLKKCIYIEDSLFTWFACVFVFFVFGFCLFVFLGGGVFLWVFVCVFSFVDKLIIPTCMMSTWLFLRYPMSIYLRVFTYVNSSHDSSHKSAVFFTIQCHSLSFEYTPIQFLTRRITLVWDVTPPY